MAEMVNQGDFTIMEIVPHRKIEIVEWNRPMGTMEILATNQVLKTKSLKNETMTNQKLEIDQPIRQAHSIQMHPSSFPVNSIFQRRKRPILEVKNAKTID